MSRRGGFWLRCGIAVAAMFVLSPVVGALMPREPFHRVMTRVLQVAVVVAFLVRRWPRGSLGAAFRAMGMRGPDRLRRYALGAVVALVLIAALLLLMWGLGGRPVQPHAHRLPLWTHLLRSIAAGVAVALFEEPVCRGYLKDVLGDVGSALLFAAVHFFRPLGGSAGAGSGYDPLLAFKRFPDLLESWTEPRLVLLGVGSLFLFAMALNRLRDRTGTLYLGMGFHAGLVFALDFYRRFLVTDLPAARRWIYGGSRLHDGLLGAAVLGLFCLAAYRVRLPRRLQETVHA